MSSPRQLLLLELNEINFDHVAYYAGRGLLPNFDRFIESGGGVTRTLSETSDDELEPWIQWVTAHTGLAFADHGVYRLGDIVKHDFPQIWERLEAKGLRVGALSPMNAKNRAREPAFFIPDPWTDTPVTGSFLLRALHRALRQAVGDNAHSRLTLASMTTLLAAAASFALPANYRTYMSLAARSRSGTWRRAMLLDLLLADVFVRLIRRTRPHFASLFLNAGAHIQHHYMFSAAAYDGPCRNPRWYAPDDVDPVLEVYHLYDRILGTIRTSFPSARIMAATGLHQDPTSELTYYWRLRDHTVFLRKIGVEFEHVEPLMSRDFRIVCSDANAAARARQQLDSVHTEGGVKLFTVDDRGLDLFVMLTYPHEIGPGLKYRAGERVFDGLDRDVAFVALKNGRHHGTGYLVDSEPGSPPPAEMPLSELPRLIMSSFGVAEMKRREAA